MRCDWLSSGKTDGDDGDGDEGEEEVLEEIPNHNQIHVNTARVGERSSPPPPHPTPQSPQVAEVQRLPPPTETANAPQLRPSGKQR